MRQEHVDIVDELNRLMAEETEACLRYFQLRYRLRGIDRQAAEEFFENGVKETLEHAEAIANQIRALGHIPRLRIELSLGGGPIRFQDALAEALDVEQQALDAYKDVLPRVLGHRGLEDFIRRRIDSEPEHGEQMIETGRAGRPLKRPDKLNRS